MLGKVFEKMCLEMNLSTTLRYMYKYYYLLIISSLFWTCSEAQTPSTNAPIQTRVSDSKLATGSQRMDLYLPDLQGKRVAIVGNQTSRIGQTHLVDTLISKGINVVKVFAPEHGFRGDAGAGETIRDGKDSKTGLPLISLYGKNKKPNAAMLVDVDVIVFDIQDVGARFYTYISTMHYVMEAAAENKKQVIVLDRPNPNGFYVDGPKLDLKYKSFVGMHPIPVVHGCTIGELALMINGEKWLAGEIVCDLKVISCDNYNHSDLYSLPIAPSPNLPNMASIYLYPSLCWFEGTVVSVGRGTELPFQSIGYPGNKTGKFHFTPKDIFGIVTDPPHEGKECTGHNLKEFGDFYITASGQIYLDWIVGMYESASDKSKFFNSSDFFDKLAGSDVMRKQIIAATSMEDIRKSWQSDLRTYKAMRKKYLLYEDFE